MEGRERPGRRRWRRVAVGVGCWWWPGWWWGLWRPGVDRTAAGSTSPWAARTPAGCAMMGLSPVGVTTAMARPKPLKAVSARSRLPVSCPAVCAPTAPVTCWGRAAEVLNGRFSAIAVRDSQDGDRRVCGVRLDGSVDCGPDFVSYLEGTYSAFTTDDGMACGLRVDGSVECRSSRRALDGFPGSFDGELSAVSEGSCAGDDALHGGPGANYIDGGDGADNCTPARTDAQCEQRRFWF